MRRFDLPFPSLWLILFLLLLCRNRALVPGSHKKVQEINAFREKHWVGESSERRWIGKGSPFIEPFSANGLMPAVTNVMAGDMVLFDTATFHGGCC